jgi:hypothetical protein
LVDWFYFHTLAAYVPVDKLDREVSEKLEAIVDVAESAEKRRLIQ